MEFRDDPDTAPIEIDHFLSSELDFDLSLLYNFLKKDPSATLTFYGGEPLMRTDLISTIVQNAPVQRFMMQTNGVLLDQLYPEIINRFSTILVSLDGREDHTDANRGAGTYRKVIENIKKISHNGYRHELIARMTVNESTDIADAVHWLADNPDYSFSSIHWQLDANFADDFSHRRFADSSGSWQTGLIIWKTRARCCAGIHSLIPWKTCFLDVRAGCGAGRGMLTTVL
jgi:sulfatase maturation enzyme AslB (radical SAM superfamily)